MTDQQILVVKKSWDLVLTMDPHMIGHVFYSRLFLQMPSLRPMFKPDMKEQYQKITDVLNLIVSKLENLEELNDEITQLAIRHTGYGVKPRHYALVGDALLWTLAKGVGTAWTEEMAIAWTKCYTLLSDTMIVAANNAQKSSS